MMKTMKKILSVFLCFLIVLSSFAMISHAVAEESYDHNPQIYVGGLGCAPIYYEDDPEKTTMFYPIDFKRVLGNLVNVGDYLKASLEKENPDILYDVVYSWLYDSFGMLALGTDGETMAEGMKVDEIELKYSGNGIYAFDYDSRLDPVGVAHRLHEYIGWVQEDSGKKKVELVGSSYGTTVVMAYLNEYKDQLENIDSVLLCVPSVGGINFFGEIFSGKLVINPEALIKFLEGKLNLPEVALALQILNKAELLPVVLDCLAIPLLRKTVYDALMQFIKDVLATLPAAWTCVQEDDFVSSLTNIFGENYNSPDHESAKLIGKIKYYHETVMTKRYSIIEDASEKGIRMNIICKYGNPPVPVSEDGNFAGDGIVELPIASFGATCVGHNKKLPADYVQAKHREYNFISTDGTLDASTGALPFNTWYIKGLQHGGKNEDYFKLIDAIVYEDLDVFKNSAYPQFLEVDKEDSERLVPMLPMEDEKETSLIEDVIRLVKRLIELIVDTVKKISKK
ncbi:MAG: hypothetical protein IKB12_09930 [Clostridia bacterium]|nr:hypothetical protein [Clostridia bacterium]